MSTEVEDLSERIARGSGRGGSASWGVGAVGCLYRSEEALDAAATQLLSLGLAADDLHLGAADEQRAQIAAQRLGIRADVRSDDPLQNIIAFDESVDPRAALDRAGVIGAVLGALGGAAISFTPAGAFIPAPRSALFLANVGLYFVLGTIVGSVLGAALGPQSSTHLGFRLIDGMQEGAYALIVTAPRERHDELLRVLQAAGGTGMTRV